MNPERLIVAAASLLLILTLGWWLLSDPQPAAPGAPTYNGAVLRGLGADVPKVGPFPHFYVNDWNPFVPYDGRVKEKDAYNPTKPPPPVIQPYVPTFRPPRTAPVVLEAPIAAANLPRLTPAAATAPQCIGLVGSGVSQMVVVRMPGVDGDVSWTPGTTVLGWTLIAIDNSNQARFTDPLGNEMIFPIGDGDLAQAQTLVAPGIDAPVKPSKPGQGALLKPMLTLPVTPAPGNGSGDNKPPRKPRRGQGGQGGQGQAPPSV